MGKSNTFTLISELSQRPELRARAGYWTTAVSISLSPTASHHSPSHGARGRGERDRDHSEQSPPPTQAGQHPPTRLQMPPNAPDPQFITSFLPSLIQCFQGSIPHAWSPPTPHTTHADNWCVCVCMCVCVRVFVCLFECVCVYV